MQKHNIKQLKTVTYFNLFRADWLSMEAMCLTVFCFIPIVY